MSNQTDNRIDVHWPSDSDPSASYAFQCLNTVRNFCNEEHQQVRFKAVYYGYFIDTAPEGLKPCQQDPHL